MIPRRLGQRDIDEDCIAGSNRSFRVRREPGPPIYTFSVSFAKQLLLSDVSYSAWANQCLLNSCSALTAEELVRDLDISHSSILATLGHIFDGERVWFLCLSTTADLGTWRLPQRPAPELSLDLLSQRWPEVWQGFERWIEDRSESDLGVELTIQLPGGVDRRFARWKILRHVLDHSTLHRGQVVGMIRMLCHQPPAINRMDYFAVERAVSPGAEA